MQASARVRGRASTRSSGGRANGSLARMHRHGPGLAQTAGRAKPGSFLPTGGATYLTMSGESNSVEVAVVGGGPAGLTAAVALAGAGIETALIAKAAAPGQPHHGAVVGLGRRHGGARGLAAVPRTSRRR